MTFANTEMKQFKDLTPEQRSEIVEAWLKGNAEAIIRETWYMKFADSTLKPDSIYRVKPSPKLDIPWHLFKHEWKWAAKDANSSILIFSSQPTIVNTWWYSMGGCTRINPLNHNFEPDGEVDWKQSLIQRPIGE